jgi:hypothetical protein
MSWLKASWAGLAFNPFVPRHRINPFGLIIWLDFHVLFVCRKFFVHRIDPKGLTSQPGYVPQETFFIESPQMGQFYESEPARSWLYRQKLLIRDICPSTCLLSWFLKKFHAKIDKQKKSIESTLLGRFYDKKNGKS